MALLMNYPSLTSVSLTFRASPTHTGPPTCRTAGVISLGKAKAETADSAYLQGLPSSCKLPWTIPRPSENAVGAHGRPSAHPSMFIWAPALVASFVTSVKADWLLIYLVASGEIR